MINGFNPYDKSIVEEIFLIIP